MRTIDISYRISNRYRVPNYLLNVDECQKYESSDDDDKPVGYWSIKYDFFKDCIIYKNRQKQWVEHDKINEQWVDRNVARKKEDHVVIESKDEDDNAP